MLEFAVVVLHFLYTNKLLSSKDHDYRADVRLNLLLEYNAILHLLVYLDHHFFSQASSKYTSVEVSHYMLLKFVITSILFF
jgi:hypothetical protein